MDDRKIPSNFLDRADGFDKVSTSQILSRTSRKYRDVLATLLHNAR